MPAVAKHAPATFERLNPWYYSDADRVHQPQLELARRQATFEEVHGGLDEHNALFRNTVDLGRCFTSRIEHSGFAATAARYQLDTTCRQGRARCVVTAS